MNENIVKEKLADLGFKDVSAAWQLENQSVLDFVKYGQTTRVILNHADECMSVYRLDEHKVNCWQLVNVGFDLPVEILLAIITKAVASKS